LVFFRVRLASCPFLMTEYSLAWKFWQESPGRANAVRGSFDCNASAFDYNESYRTHCNSYDKSNGNTVCNTKPVLKVVSTQTIATTKRYHSHDMCLAVCCHVAASRFISSPQVVCIFVNIQLDIVKDTSIDWPKL
jgi:hypothetical protein